MDLSVYLVTATIVTFTVGAAFALWYSIADGQWKQLGPGRARRAR